MNVDFHFLYQGLEKEDNTSRPFSLAHMTIETPSTRKWLTPILTAKKIQVRNICPIIMGLNEIGEFPPKILSQPTITSSYTILRWWWVLKNWDQGARFAHQHYQKNFVNKCLGNTLQLIKNCWLEDPYPTGLGLMHRWANQSGIWKCNRLNHYKEYEAPLAWVDATGGAEKLERRTAITNTKKRKLAPAKT